MKSLLFSMLFLAASAAGAAAEPSPRPNVVVLLVDDLGWGDVSCLHLGAVKTPNIDRIAPDIWGQAVKR